MDWQKLTSDIHALGLTQTQIAARIGSSQSYVCKLLRATAVVRAPRYPVARALLALHDELIGGAK